MTLDLADPPTSVLGQIDQIAERLRRRAAATLAALIRPSGAVGAFELTGPVFNNHRSRPPGRHRRRQVFDPGLVTGSEGVGNLATAAGVPPVFWFLGGTEPALVAEEALKTGRLPDNVPSNHSPYYTPLIEPTLEAGVTALVAAAREWLGKPRADSGTSSGGELRPAGIGGPQPLGGESSRLPSGG